MQGGRAGVWRAWGGRCCKIHVRCPRINARTHIYGGSCKGSEGTCCLRQWVFFFPFVGWSPATIQNVYFSEETLTSPFMRQHERSRILPKFWHYTLEGEKKQNKTCFTEKALSLGLLDVLRHRVPPGKRIRVLTTCEPRGGCILWSIWGLTEQRRHRWWTVGVTRASISPCSNV